MFEEQTIQSRGICSPIRLSDEFVTQELASIKIASIQSWGLYVIVVEVTAARIMQAWQYMKLWLLSP